MVWGPGQKQENQLESSCSHQARDGGHQSDTEVEGGQVCIREVGKRQP